LKNLQRIVRRALADYHQIELERQRRHEKPGLCDGQKLPDAILPMYYDAPAPGRGPCFSTSPLQRSPNCPATRTPMKRLRLPA
jgi:hypothetical protein